MEWGFSHVEEAVLVGDLVSRPGTSRSVGDRYPS
jgi:hypothetical protein